MDQLNNLLASIKSDPDGRLPPVEKWNPEYCGEMNLILRANGDWLHEGEPLKRKKLVTLFSTILKKEDEQYFLVSPVEKIGIQVEWQPFVIIDFNVIKHYGKDCFVFTDNCGNETLLTESAQIIFSEYQQQNMPILRIRRNLYASFNRSTYYRLIEQANIVETVKQQELHIISMDFDFCVGKVDRD